MQSEKINFIKKFNSLESSVKNILKKSCHIKKYLKTNLGSSSEKKDIWKFRWEIADLVQSEKKKKLENMYLYVESWKYILRISNKINTSVKGPGGLKKIVLQKML